MLVLIMTVQGGKNNTVKSLISLCAGVLQSRFKIAERSHIFIPVNIVQVF